MGEIRKFATGATRDTDAGKLDYEGFYSPIVLERFAKYMHKNRVQSDGSLRDSDNWQNGIPKDQYMKSMFRHFMEVWKWHRGFDSQAEIEDALCALIFNAQGYLFELLMDRDGAPEPIMQDETEEGHRTKLAEDAEARNILERFLGMLKAA